MTSLHTTAVSCREPAATRCCFPGQPGLTSVDFSGHLKVLHRSFPLSALCAQQGLGDEVVGFYRIIGVDIGFPFRMILSTGERWKGSVSEIAQRLARAYQIVCLESPLTPWKNLLEVQETIKFYCGQHHTLVLTVPEDYASTQICSVCEVRGNWQRPGIKSWTCGSCGSWHDRDVNAARNIKREAVRLFKEKLDV